jgi:hypothetical protein
MIGRSVTGTGSALLGLVSGVPGWRAEGPAHMGSVHGLAARTLDHWSSARRGRTASPVWALPGVEMLKRG